MCIVYGILKKIKIPVELSVAHLLLLHSELLPVTLLLGPQGSDLALVLLEPVVRDISITTKSRLRPLCVCNVNSKTA